MSPHFEVSTTLSFVVTPCRIDWHWQTANDTMNSIVKKS
jgi:hypothetical protein